MQDYNNSTKPHQPRPLDDMPADVIPLALRILKRLRTGPVPMQVGHPATCACYWLMWTGHARIWHVKPRTWLIEAQQGRGSVRR